MRLTSVVALAAVLLLSAQSVAFARGEINIKPPADKGDGPVIVIDRPQPDKPANNEPYDENLDEGDHTPDLEQGRPEVVDGMHMACAFVLTDHGLMVVFTNDGTKTIKSGLWTYVFVEGDINTNAGWKWKIDIEPGQSVTMGPYDPKAWKDYVGEGCYAEIYRI